jgi:hypothetical protein
MSAFGAAEVAAPAPSAGITTLAAAEIPKIITDAIIIARRPTRENINGFRTLTARLPTPYQSVRLTPRRKTADTLPTNILYRAREYQPGQGN